MIFKCLPVLKIHKTLTIWLHAVAHGPYSVMSSEYMYPLTCTTRYMYSLTCTIGYMSATQEVGIITSWGQHGQKWDLTSTISWMGLGIVVLICTPNYAEDLGKWLTEWGWPWAKMWDTIWKTTNSINAINAINQ
jgi:hypothetical protein